LVKQLSHLPIILDPSQGTGNRDLIEPLSLAGLAAGADGLIIEVHNQPEEALSDCEQSVYLDQLENMIPKFQQQANFRGKKLGINTSAKSTSL
jgi:3-deoxy-7-phosphoheptulonate synthase